MRSCDLCGCRRRVRYGAANPERGGSCPRVPVVDDVEPVPGVRVPRRPAGVGTGSCVRNPYRPSEIYHLRHPNSRDLKLRALSHRLVQVTNQIERLLWQFVKFTGQNLIKAADRIF